MLSLAATSGGLVLKMFYVEGFVRGCCLETVIGG